jgi:hypothetical protein
MITKYLITSLNREVAHGLNTDGYYYFQSKRLLDAFGLSDSPAEKAKAIDLILTFNKQLNSLQCDLMRVGFVRLDKPPPGSDPEQEVGVWHGFTYTVQSRRHQNDPLLVTESFRMDFPVLALANMTASMWIQAYQNRPQEVIFQVSHGN